MQHTNILSTFHSICQSIPPLILFYVKVRHVDFGVTERMYGTVGECLLKTLEVGLGDDWNDDVKESWTWVYGIMADVMTKAAYHSK